jgi:hypothetical protein
LPLFALFCALVSFVFNNLQPLFAKYRGVWGASATAQRTLRLFTLLAPIFEGSLEGRVILCLCFCRPAAPRCFGSSLNHSLADLRALYLPLESTLAKVYQNK